MTEIELQQYLLREYPQENARCEWKEFKNLKNSFCGDEKGITCVIGSSLGGFYALSCNTSVCKIVINPCMDPAVEIPKLTDVPDLDFIALKISID